MNPLDTPSSHPPPDGNSGSGPALDDIPERLRAAEAAGQLSSSAVANIRRWLTAAPYAAHRDALVERIRAGAFAELQDAFWEVIPFGTSGRRGRMYPIGTAVLNDRTVAESAQGVADYLNRRMGPGRRTVVIAYDTRHHSAEFARLCAAVFVANGFEAFLFDGFRATPELSFAVRHLGCAIGLMISASHNPPADNGIKCYGPTGGQVVPPDDRGIIESVYAVERIQEVPFEEARAAGKVQLVGPDVDAAFVRAVCAESLSDRRAVRILYTPFHGVGMTSVHRVLDAAGFADIRVFGPQAEPSGDFPNIPGHSANPETPATLDLPIRAAIEQGCDLVLASDPDADRIGVAVPAAGGSGFTPLTGNQIAVLLADYVLGQLASRKQLTPEHYLVKTLVTTEMLDALAVHYGVRMVGNLLVGFKWIGQVIDRDPEHFVFGAEESHGYLRGTYCRDKDASVAALLMAELAAELKARGRTVLEHLDGLAVRHGYYAEQQISEVLPGQQGNELMRQLMARLRTDPPRSLGGMAVVRVDDYAAHQTRLLAGKESVQPLPEPSGDLIIFGLAEPGNRVAARPSGTEPKIKFYLFGHSPVDGAAGLAAARDRVAQRLDRLAAEIRALVRSAVTAAG